jgi:glycosyltransferase involved in cell wall biosynthesis
VDKLAIAAQVHAYPPEVNAGAEMMLHSMLRALVLRGHACTVYIASYTHVLGTKPYMLDGVRVVPLRAREPFGLAAFGADVLVSHLDYLQDTMNHALALKKPLVQVLHNTRIDTAMLATCYADILVYNSVWQRDYLGNDARGIIVRPPVFADDYRTTPGTKVLLANISEDKGGLVFWELARRMPDVEFLAAVGAHSVQILGDLPNVELVPNTPDMKSVYSKTRVTLMPSFYESWGRVGTESMVSGIPVIAHPTPGLLENLGDAGVFIDRDDIDAWEAKIRQLQDNRRWLAASRRAKARAKELDPTEDLNRWCDRVEEVARDHSTATLSLSG